MIKAIELFGGIGAATQALKRQFGKENVEIVDYVELDKHAVKSYNSINGTNFVPTDINDINMEAYKEVDILIAGWPCQDYSVAGKGLGLEGTRSNLILLTISKIKEMTNRPKHILLENVKGLLSKRHKDDLEYIKELFDKLGYNWNQAMLNSKHFGVPQARERVFMLLTRKDLPMKRIDHLEQINTVDKVLADVLDFTEPTQTITLKQCLENKNVIIKNGKPVYVLSDNSTRSLFEVKGDNKTINISHSNNYTNNVMGTKEGQMPTIMAGSTRYVYLRNEMSQYNGKIIELDTDKLNNQDRDKINKIATLGILENNEYKTNDFGAKDRFYGIDGQHSTATATDIGRSKIMFNENAVIHYRKLSTLECWRLMGFSDEAHNKCKEMGVSNSQLAKQAGNSIVVNVLEAIFQELFKGGNNE